VDRRKMELGDAARYRNGRKALVIEWEPVRLVRLDGSEEPAELPIRWEESEHGAYRIRGLEVKVVPYLDIDALPDVATIARVESSHGTITFNRNDTH
jgi:hypothetical protein